MELFRRLFGKTAAVPFVNIHCHSLAAVDDGAASETVMEQMLRRAYEDGIRFLCFTPHFHPPYFQTDPARIACSFEKAQKFAEAELPGLRLFLGNEIFCRQNTAEQLHAGRCRTLNGGSHVLVEFAPSEEFSTMQSDLLELCNAGFRPVLAHVERYRALYHEERAAQLHRSLIFLQGNCRVLAGPRCEEKAFLKKLIRSGTLDIVADDCHNLGTEQPGLSAGYDAICRQFEEDEAERLFYRNPLMVLTDGVLPPQNTGRRIPIYGNRSRWEDYNHKEEENIKKIYTI